MKIDIKSIPHSEQRYPTVGDWWYEPDGTLRIRISEFTNWRYTALVAVHELVEVLLCRHAGVNQDQVDEFDMAFEAGRKPGNIDEPGDDSQAPYKYQHCIATGVERVLAAFMGVSWAEYDEAVNAL